MAKFKKMSKKSRKYIYACMAACLISGLAGCTGKTNPKSSDNETVSSVLEYQYDKEKSKSFVKFSDKPDTQIEVSEYVSNFNNGGDLIMSAGAYDKLFGLKESDATENEQRLFGQYETENNYSSDTGEVVKLSNGEHTFLFREGSSMCLVDNTIKELSSPFSKDESGNYTYSIFDIIFNLGYESIGTSVNNNNLIYTIYSASEVDSPSAETEASNDSQSASGTSENNESPTDSAEEEAGESKSTEEAVNEENTEENVLLEESVETPETETQTAE